MMGTPARQTSAKDPDRAAHGGYLPIEDYALIGDGISAALVGRDGAIDWACFPRFDSPAAFARLLDAADGGHWQIAPAGAYTVERRYLDDTNVLATTFTTDTGAVELLDFMPPQYQGGHATILGDSAIVRIARGLAGTVELRCDFAPRFDYARPAGRARTPWRTQPGAGARVAHGGRESLTLHTAVPLTIDDAADTATGGCSLGEGEEAIFLLTYRGRTALLWHRDIAATAQRLLEQTTEYWRGWIGRCAYDGPYGAMVRRAALALKLLDYAPTGAIVAAPTTSLPERLGGARNWDYRYSWLRDTAFTLYALFGLGYGDEGEIFLDWVMDAAYGDPTALQVLYSVTGEDRIEESELAHLAGYRGSRPVRIGNAAYGQRQLDIYGEVLDCAYLFHKHGGVIAEELWAFLRAVVEHVCRVWTEPDQGIWEVRSGPAHFVYSKALCWVAVDRGITLARRCDLPADLERWERVRDTIHEELLREGYNAEVGAFTQAYGQRHLDAAALALPLRKVVPATDPRMAATIDRVAAGLGRDGLLHRYAVEHVDDGVGGAEGYFLMCSFWLVECYALLGRADEACALFERLLGYANDVGLYAEELDPDSGHHLGNFPQAFTHVALINAALSLERAAGASE